MALTKMTCELRLNDADAVRRATLELIDSALTLAAYAEGMVKTGHGTKDATRNMASDVVRKADAARAALRASLPSPKPW